jgi:hypothetical protein
MAKNVIILGAGASVEFGAPVMSNFLDVARSLFASNATGEHSASFFRVFRAISVLQGVHSKAEFDLVNLESIFTAFEMAKTLNRFPGDPNIEIDQLIEDLKWVIVVTLEKSIRFRCSRGELKAHSNMDRFMDEIIQSWEVHGVGSTSILTFNYDLIVDIAVWSASQKHEFEIDYGLTGRSEKKRILPVLKLHGSLNWLQQKNSPQVVPWGIADFLAAYRSEFRRLDEEVNLNVGTRISAFSSRCGFTDSEAVPFIVPPSWNKADSHRSIAKVWERAAVELSEAQSIFIVGYSLPHTDSFFRQLYALGSFGEQLLQRFWVFDPDSSRQEVFRSMLGPGARTRYQFFNIGFGASINKIREALWSKS